MGWFRKREDEQTELAPRLEAVDPPIQAFPMMLRDKQVQLEYKQKLVSMKTEDITVFDSKTDQPILTAKGKTLYARKFKSVMTPKGEPLFNMRVKLAAVNLRFICEDAERGTVFFEIKREFAWKIKLNLRQSVTVGGAPTLHLVGNYSGSQARVTIKDSGQLIAVFDRELAGMQNHVLYRLSVAPGVDLALITALCLAWDKAKSDDAKAAAS